MLWATRQMPRAVQCCAVLPTYTGGAEATGGGVPALPTAAIQLLSEESEGYEGLPSSYAWPFALAQPSDGPHPRIPWAALQQMPAASTASFGVASCDEQIVQSVQERVAIVEAARAKTLVLKQITHYKCMSCRKLVPNEEKACGSCGQERAENGALATQEREKARAAARQNTRKGRRRNKCSDAVVPALSLEVAPLLTSTIARWPSQKTKLKFSL